MSGAVLWLCSSVPTVGTAQCLAHHIPVCSCEETRNWGCFALQAGPYNAAVQPELSPRVNVLLEWG